MIMLKAIAVVLCVELLLSTYSGDLGADVVLAVVAYLP